MADNGSPAINILWIGQTAEPASTLPDKFRITFISETADLKRKVEELLPDLIVLDLTDDIGQKFRSILDIHQVLLSTPVLGLVVAGSEVLGKAIEAGLHDFLFIPFSTEELESRIYLATRRLDVAQAYGHASGYITTCFIDLELPTNFKLIAPLADILTRDLGSSGLTSGEVVFHLRLTLSELLTNAMEHGSLGITLEEKIAALEEGSFDRLLAQRMADERLAGRRIRVKANRSMDKAVFSIQDQGAGFDVTETMSRLAELDPLLPCGRGLYLLQQFVDDFRFEDGGRRVILEKRLTPDRTGEA